MTHPLWPVLGKCSTPFGIYEVGTRQTTKQRLDAMRAQRLSASMRLALEYLSSPMFRKECAQRLSASMRLAHSSGTMTTRMIGVLNAFRHL